MAMVYFWHKLEATASMWPQCGGCNDVSVIRSGHFLSKNWLALARVSSIRWYIMAHHGTVTCQLPLAPIGGVTQSSTDSSGTWEISYAHIKCDRKKTTFVQSPEDYLEKLHSSVSKKILQVFYRHLDQLKLNKCILVALGSERDRHLQLMPTKYGREGYSCGGGWYYSICFHMLCIIRV